MYIIFPNKIKNKKKDFEKFAIITKVCSHEFKGTKFRRNEIAWLPCLIFYFCRRIKFHKLLEIKSSWKKIFLSAFTFYTLEIKDYL